MGDSSTHVIFYSAYWHLARLEDGVWIGTADFEKVCDGGEPETIIKLQH